MIGRDSRDDMALGLLRGYFTGPLLNGQEVAEAEANWPGSRRSTYRYKRDEDRWEGRKGHVGISNIQVTLRRLCKV